MNRKSQTKHKPASPKRRNNHKTLIITSTTLLCILALCVMALSVFAMKKHALKDDESEQSAQIDPANDSKAPAGFSFIGTGDCIVDDTIYTYYEYYNGNREFAPIFEYTAQTVEPADLSFINLKTPTGGDSYGISGSPRYNGPLEMLNALNQTGFNWYGAASNHALDSGKDALINEVNYIRTTFPDASVSGASRNQEESGQPVIREINGIRVALISMTNSLGSNKLKAEDSWVIDTWHSDEGGIDYPGIKDRLSAAEAQSDVQIVSVEWGNEDDSSISDQQRELAAFLADQGADVILGSGPGVIQPVEYIQSGSGTTLCYYSLGNYLSAAQTRENLIGGMAAFNLNYDFATGTVSFNDVKFIPTVMYYTPSLNEFRTNTLQTYTDAMAANQYVTYVAGTDFSRDFVKTYVSGIMGSPENIQLVLD